MPFESKSQAAKCWVLKKKHQNGSWDCAEWAHATKSIKALPEYVPDSEKKAVASQEAFKRGFLLACAEQGLSIEEITKRAEDIVTYLEKSAGMGLDALKGVSDMGLAGLVGAPLAAGYVGGHLFAKVRNNAEANDVDTLRLKTRLLRYQQLADAAERQAKLRAMQEKHPGELVQIA